MSAPQQCRELAEALHAIIVEETERLTDGEPAMALTTLVASKLRLADQLGNLLQASRGHMADPAEREALASVLARLVEAAEENGKLIARRRSLADDLMQAVLGEARRRGGATIATYRGDGRATNIHRATAVALDSRL